MTRSNNGGDRLVQLEALVLDFARTVNQSQTEYNHRLRETEERLAEHIQTTNENFRVVQQEISELRESQQRTDETVRSLGELTRSIGQAVENLSTEVLPRVAEQVSTTSAGLEQLERTVDYLMRRDQEQNGGQQ